MALQIRPFWARCLRLWDVGAGFLNLAGGWADAADRRLR